MARAQNCTIYTEIDVRKPFYSAEDYHQKWTLSHCDPLMDELRGIYANFDQLVDSPTASRLNAYLAGHLDKTTLAEEAAQFGLSQTGRDLLLKKVR